MVRDMARRVLRQSLDFGRKAGLALLTGIRRYPYIAIALVAAIGAGIGFWAYQQHQTAVWKNATDAYRHADYQKAYRELKNQPLPGDANDLRVYAQTMLATQHLDQALKGYQKLYEKTKDAQAKIVIGNIYNEKREYDKAVTVYEELISSNPGFIQAYVNLATVRRLQGNPSAALEVARRGVTNNPSNVILSELMVSLTMDNKKSGDYQTAIANLKRLNPNDPLLEMLKEVPIR